MNEIDIWPQIFHPTSGTTSAPLSFHITCDTLKSLGLKRLHLCLLDQISFLTFAIISPNSEQSEVK